MNLHRRPISARLVPMLGALLLLGGTACTSDFRLEVPEDHPAHHAGASSGPLVVPDPFALAAPGASSTEFREPGGEDMKSPSAEGGTGSRGGEGHHRDGGNARSPMQGMSEEEDPR